MKRVLICLILASILCFGSIVQAMTGRDIMQAVEDRNSGNSLHALMGMDLIDKNGDVSERVLEIWSVVYDQENDLSKSIIEFKAPSSVKNTRFLQIENLTRGDDKWIYLPALKRIRRIAVSEGNSSFMGSDFTYDDLGSKDLDESSHILLREEVLEKYECYVVESVPIEVKDSAYSKVITWITKEHLIPVRIEMYNKETDKLQKLLQVEQNIVQIDGVWTVFDSMMKNLETGHSTRFYVKRSPDDRPYIEFNKKINPNRFTQRFLETGKVQ